MEEVMEHRPKGYWTEETVEYEIRQRHHKGLSMMPAHIDKDDGGLYQAAIKFFGSWTNLYAQLNMDIDVQVRRPRGYWSKGTVTKELVEWYYDGNEMNAGEVSKLNRGLYIAAITQYGSWDNALNASGFKSEDMRRNLESGTWTKEYTIDRIKHIHESGLSLTPKEMVQNRENYNVYNNGIRLFGAWHKALEASGYDPEDIYDVRRPKGYWTPEKVITFLADRYKKGYSINAEEMNGAGYGSLYREAIKHFGNWSSVRSKVERYIWENS